MERATGDTTAFEYVVRKSNGELVSVTQKDKAPLPPGQKVLVIAGPQARIVPDYTVPAEVPVASVPPAALLPANGPKEGPRREVVPEAAKPDGASVTFLKPE